MSRCYPFPPPGYVKNAPVELEVPSKKERRKHKDKDKDKDKKKKRQRHSSTNGDLTIKDGEQEIKEFKKSGQPNEGFVPEIERLPSGTISQGAIQRLQTESSGDETFSKCDLATDLKREQGFRPREELPLRSTLAAENLEADSSRPHVLSKGVNGTNSCPGIKSITEGLTNGDKKLRLDMSRGLPNGASVASGCKRPEQAENSTFSNGVLSTKRKRLQADNSGDNLLPDEVNCKKFDGQQSGRSKPNVFLQATNGSSLQAVHTDNTMILKNGQPTHFERSEKRPRADHSRLKVRTDGACSSIVQAEIGKARDVPCRPLANNGDLQGDKFKPDALSNGVMATNSAKLQRNGFSVRPPINGMLTTNCDGSDKRLQPEKIRDSSLSNSLANNLNQKMHAGSSSMASQSERSDQRLQGRTKVFPNGVSSAKVKQAISRHDMGVLAVKTTADKTGNIQTMLPNTHERSDLRLDGFRNGVLSNGVVAAALGEESNQARKVDTNPSATARSAATGDYSLALIKAASTHKVSLDLEDKSFKEILMKLRIPRTEQALVTSEDEDWLVSCKQPLQSKQGEKGGEEQIPQVWAEAVLLPAVGINALPYVIPT